MATLIQTDFNTEQACTNICEDTLPSDFTIILDRGQDGGAQEELGGLGRDLGKTLSLKFERIGKKQENCWQEQQEQKGYVSALVNPWLQVSRSQEDMGEREGEGSVPALALTAQSSSGLFTAGFIHP